MHPDFVDDYIAPEECQISYNPTLMALIWEALATREVKLLRHSMSKRFDLPEQTAWVNYVRVHDDIGWSFADEDAAEVWIDGFGHRQFLNQFYTGTFTGSFAKWFTRSITIPSRWICAFLEPAPRWLAWKPHRIPAMRSTSTMRCDVFL